MDKVVHFEIPVDDRDRAKEFYSSIFDWDLVSLEQNSHRYNASVLSGFHNLRSPGVTPGRALLQ